MNSKLLGVALMCLLIGVGIGYGIFSFQLSALQLYITDLESDIVTISNSYDQLNDSYHNLLASYVQLEQQVQTTTNSYNLLNDLYHDLVTAYTQLEEQVQYNLYVLNDQEYYTAVKNDLQRANETVNVAMYSMLYDPDDTFDWANDLIRELVNAKERGISVTVIIENRTFFGSMSDNVEAYAYLLANDVTVYMDNDSDTDHMKLIIIDGEIVYVGSHNWSESALYYNRETSVKIVSKSIALTFMDYFVTIGD